MHECAPLIILNSCIFPVFHQFTSTVLLQWLRLMSNDGGRRLAQYCTLNVNAAYTCITTPWHFNSLMRIKLSCFKLIHIKYPCKHVSGGVELSKMVHWICISQLMTCVCPCADVSVRVRAMTCPSVRGGLTFLQPEEILISDLSRIEPQQTQLSGRRHYLSASRPTIHRRLWTASHTITAVVIRAEQNGIDIEVSR